jgi:hypothetical protein
LRCCLLQRPCGRWRRARLRPEFLPMR